ncbi:sensor histidine kinase [Luteipulveratus flavus]|uniref:Sensor-like histidine kinase SenX3 n=1 Tax=Luteipulveratus flavus TaxID=3031728 RepID=A0ABT6C1Z3_9MICO|nr:HAMP domain-containing sensor histidine kinase [Luteipulveratus sp. YIM 133296]MDF8262680.1 HAMP domain-containing sensor histidine kinase [Luteipulveratus sp. YIM 133296]
MNHTASILLTALGWGAAGAVAAWLVTWPLRRWSHAGGLASIAAVATVAAVAAVVGNTRAMFITMDDEYVTIIAALVAGLLAAVAAIAAARTFRLDSAALRRAVSAIGEGRVPERDARSVSGELRDLRDDLHRTARTLAETREREQALERSRRDLVTWISHDLRTPLAGLRAMAESLEDGVAADPDRYHRQMRVEVDRLTEMVDDLFHLSRLHAGSGVGRRERVNLADLVSDALAGLEPVAGLQGVRLVGSSHAMAEVEGDSAQLNRALTNLVYNAIRHTRTDGTVSLMVSAGPQADRVLVTVSDECGGIPEGEVPRLFEVGYRGQQARSPHPGLGSGAGLGLAITQEIVTAHDGSVDVANTGPGCTFSVQLPLAR